MRNPSFLLFLFLLPACQPAEGSGTAPAKPPAALPQAEGPAAATLDAGSYDQFGAGVREGATVSVADVLKDPKAYDGKELRVSGTVREVCQTKGCWMRVGGEGKEAQVFVKFKDYGFFVPKDAAGREAVLEGVVTIREVPVEEVKHYLEDAGKAEEAAKVTEPAKEVRVMAAGVAMSKPTGG